MFSFGSLVMIMVTDFFVPGFCLLWHRLLRRTLQVLNFSQQLMVYRLLLSDPRFSSHMQTNVTSINFREVKVFIKSDERSL